MAKSLGRPKFMRGARLRGTNKRRRAYHRPDPMAKGAADSGVRLGDRILRTDVSEDPARSIIRSTRTARREGGGTSEYTRCVGGRRFPKKTKHAVWVTKRKTRAIQIGCLGVHVKNTAH